MKHLDDPMTRFGKAFKILRKVGYATRRNQSYYPTGDECLTTEEARKAVVCYRDDEEDLNDTGEGFVAWNGDGHLICKVFNSCGIETRWNGNPSDRIRVALT